MKNIEKLKAEIDAYGKPKNIKSLKIKFSLSMSRHYTFQLSGK